MIRVPHVLPEAARRLAAGAGGVAGEVRAVARALEAAAVADWASTAAHRYRDALAEEVAASRRSADLVEDAARAVLAHAVALEQLWLPDPADAVRMATGAAQRVLR